MSGTIEVATQALTQVEFSAEDHAKAEARTRGSSATSSTRITSTSALWGAMRRELQEPRALSGARKTLGLVEQHLGRNEHAHLQAALGLLERAADCLDREPMAD